MKIVPRKKIIKPMKVMKKPKLPDTGCKIGFSGLSPLNGFFVKMLTKLCQVVTLLNVPVPQETITSNININIETIYIKKQNQLALILATFIDL
jgi:hypothetical protein